jgi:hypothetical protein
MDGHLEICSNRRPSLRDRHDAIQHSRSNPVDLASVSGRVTDQSGAVVTGRADH